MARDLIERVFGPGLDAVPRRSRATVTASQQGSAAGPRFDALARVFAAPHSRRLTFGALLAAALAPLGVAAAPKKGQQCLADGRICGKRRKQRSKKRRSNKRRGKGQPCNKCCSRFSVKAGKVRRCRCKPDGASCGNNVQCCSGQCQAGACRACDVCPSGCAFDKVQDAITAATAGATIRLCPGTYTEHIRFTKSLTLVGAGVSSTTLDGGGIASDVAVVRVNAGTTVVIRGLTITGGNTGETGGGGIHNRGALTLDDVTVRGNTSTGWGGGINTAGGPVTLTNVSLTENTSGDVGGGMIIFSGTVTVSNSTVADNAADWGGGISNYDGVLTLDRVSVTGNTAADNGGGLHNVPAGTVTIRNGSTIAENEAVNGGGGIRNDGTLILDDATMTENSANRGGGIFNHNIAGEPEATLTVVAGTVIGNEANLFGGGIFNNGGAATIEPGGSITGNTSNDGAGTGGGIYNNGGTVTIEQGATVKDNNPDNCEGDPVNGTCPTP